MSFVDSGAGARSSDENENEKNGLDAGIGGNDPDDSSKGQEYGDGSTPRDDGGVKGEQQTNAMLRGNSPRHYRSESSASSSSSSAAPLVPSFPKKASVSGDGDGRLSPMQQQQQQSPVQSCTSGTSSTTTPLAFSPSSRRWAVLLYSLTTILLFADQNLLAPNLTAAADEFGFNELERDRKLGGDIALAFFVLGAPASFIVGCMADSHRRAPLFALTVGVGESACLATYFTTTYAQLYVCRALTGFSVGGALPLIYSVLGDLFEAHERPAVSAMVGMGCGVGIAFGQAVAGYLGPKFGWRLPFLVVSIPALLCALIVLLTVTDPVRGGMEKAYLERKEVKEYIVDMSKSTPRKRKNEEQRWINDGTVELVPLEHTYLECGDDGSMEKKDVVPAAATKTEGSHPPQREPSLSPPQSRESSPVPGTLPTHPVPRLVHEAMDQGHPFLGIEGLPFQGDTAASTLDRGLDNNAPHSAAEENSFLKMDWISHLRTLFLLLKTPTVLLAILQGAPGCIPWGIVNTYLNDFLSEDRGMTVQGATTTVLIFGLGNFVGMTVGGAGGNYLYKMDPRYPAFLSGSTAILGCIPTWLLINTVNSQSLLLYIGATSLLAGVGSGVTGPIVKAMLQNATLPTSRGQAFALLNTFDDFGRGLGPVFVAKLIAGMGGRTPAFNVGILGWVFCGLFNLCMYFTILKDELKVQSVFADSLNRQLATLDEVGYVATGAPRSTSYGHSSSSSLNSGDMELV